MRPNNESHIKKSKVTIALKMAFNFGKQVALDVKQPI